MKLKLTILGIVILVVSLFFHSLDNLDRSSKSWPNYTHYLEMAKKRLLFSPKNSMIANTKPSIQPAVLGQLSPPREYKFTVFLEKDYSVIYYIIDNSEILFINNLNKNFTSQDVVKNNSCDILTSATFYTKEGKHIGLFIENGETINSEVRSTLFDGVLSINYFETPKITRLIPKDDLKYALQSGPILLENDNYQHLSIRNDKQARRIFAIVTGENGLIVGAVFDPNSQYLGPKLSDMPIVIEKLEEKSGLNFADAINLDGGTASAYISDSSKLTEASPVGSYLCAR